MGGEAGIRQVADLLVVGDDYAFGFEFGGSLHRDALARGMHPHFLVLVQLIAPSIRHVTVLHVDGVSHVSNLRRVLKVVRHRHLCRD